MRAADLLSHHANVLLLHHRVVLSGGWWLALDMLYDYVVTVVTMRSFA